MKPEKKQQLIKTIHTYSQIINCNQFKSNLQATQLLQFLLQELMTKGQERCSKARYHKKGKHKGCTIAIMQTEWQILYKRQFSIEINYWEELSKLCNQSINKIFGYLSRNTSVTMIPHSHFGQIAYCQQTRLS